MSDHTRSRLDTKIKVHENRVRRRLGRNGYLLRKSRRHLGVNNQGQYQVMHGNKIIAGQNYKLSLDDIEHMLFLGDLFLYWELKKYLIRLYRRNPWYQQQGPGGGHKCLTAFYSKHFLSPEKNRELPPDEKVRCKKCESEQVIKSGKVNKKQRFHCKTCGCHFTIGDNRFRNQSAKSIVQILYG